MSLARTAPLRTAAVDGGALGVEIDVGGVRLGVADRSGRLRYRHFASLDVRASGRDELTRTLVRLVNGALRSAQEMAISVDGVCVVVPGHVDTAAALIRHATHLGWRDLPLDELLPADEVAAPVQPVLESTARASALSEARARPDGPADLLYIGGSDGGIDGALVLGGVLHRGASGRAGELGHAVVDPAGPPCPCGGTGCLDVKAGIPTILRTAGLHPRAGAVDGAALDELVRRLDAGERHARAAVSEAGMHLGTALAMAARTIDPPLVVVGGTYARLLDWLRPTATAALRMHAPGSPLLAPDRLSVSVLGTDAALLGAIDAAVPSLVSGHR